MFQINQTDLANMQTFVSERRCVMPVLGYSNCGGCTNTCEGGCEGSCHGGCARGCSSSCDGGCSSGCYGGCDGGCYGR